MSARKSAATADQVWRIDDGRTEGAVVLQRLSFDNGETPCEVAVHDGDIPEHIQANSVIRFRAVCAYTAQRYPGLMCTVKPQDNAGWYTVRVDAGARQLTRRVRVQPIGGVQ